MIILKSNILKLFSGSLLSQMAWMLSMMILARVYIPESFATYQIFISTVNILSIFATARYDVAIVVPKYKWQAVNILILSLGISLVVFLLMIFCIIPCQIIYEKIYGVYDSIWNWLPMAVLLISIYNCLYNWNVREKKYTLLSLEVLIFPLLYLLFSIMIKQIWDIESGLIYAFVLSRLVQVAIFAACYVRDNRKYIAKFRYISFKKYAAEYVNFPKYMIVGGFIDNFSASCPVYLLNYFFGKEITGYYSIAMQALSAPSALVAKSVGDVFRQKMGELFSHSQDCRGFYDKNLFLLSKLSVVLGVGIVLFAPQAYAFVFGDIWAYSGILSQYMLLAVCLSLVASPLSSIYIVSYNQKKYLLIQILYLMSNFTGIVIGSVFFDNVELALLIASVEIAIVSMISIYKGRMITC